MRSVHLLRGHPICGRYTPHISSHVCSMLHDSVDVVWCGLRSLRAKAQCDVASRVGHK
jgi:hypothetical protein